MQTGVSQASGFYIYRMQAGENTQAGSVVLNR